MKPRRSITLVGYGAISRKVIELLRGDGDVVIDSVLVREQYVAAATAELPSDISVVTQLNQLQPSVSLIVETAGQSAVLEYGPASLTSNRDFVIVSAAALQDESLLHLLRTSAAHSGRSVHIVGGAIGGLDAIAAAKISGLKSVRYTGIKPPQAWLGTPAETAFDLQAIKSREVIFEGDAREVSRQYPKNANVAATIALAGMGFEKTSVILIADAAASQNVHLVEVEAMAANIKFEIKAFPLSSNPKTSAITAYSIVNYLRTGFSAVRL